MIAIYAAPRRTCAFLAPRTPGGQGVIEGRPARTLSKGGVNGGSRKKDVAVDLRFVAGFGCQLEARSTIYGLS